MNHLDRVVKDAKNKNVALTGRYGIGKSSVLDRFQETHEGKVLRVSITTLGPDRDGEGLTNRIQKELVKQLIYRTEPSELRSSRFARTDPITRRKAITQSAIATAVLGLFLGLGGWLPDVATFPGDLSRSWMSVRAVVMFLLAWALFYGTATAILSWLRLALDSRIITSLSTAGTAITLGERDDTYFDAYLDELVTYFDRGGEDFVIFEDLDRFDDPAIFDSLRELNTILNSSPRRIAAASKRQLCFIYAIKDSLFERLAQSEPKQDPEAQRKADGEQRETDDHAGAQRSATAQQESGGKVRALRESLAERSNRTKFFDVVIPMVPFLSHRNARDVLDKALAQRNIPADTVSRALLSLVARHATDMRLLLNILNEFTVYAQRLLWVSHPAPELTGDRLFALVAYKNFHLADFENIPVRKSALDELDRGHRNLVRHAASSRQRDRRQARDLVLTEARQSELADRLGRELIGAARAVLLQTNFRELAQYRVGGETFSLTDSYTIGFWQTVVQHQSIFVVPLNGKQPYVAAARQLDQATLQDWFPEAFDENVWSNEHTDATGRRIEKLAGELDFLPGAGYTDLLERTEFIDVQGRTFSDLLEAHLTSDIARELVQKGYINRNFATYSAAFYGTFAGIDAETFYYRAVQPNEMLLDHRFNTDDSLRNLLDQLDADEPDFYRTVSALNPQIVSYLLEHRHERAREVAGFLATHFDDEAREFMATYLADDHALHASLIGLLAAHPWRGLFDHLASEEVPDNLRLRLVDAALTDATAVGDFDLGQDIRGFIADHYTEMLAFTEERTERQAKVVKDFASKCGVQVEKLASVPEPLQKLLVASEDYVLTADNLRTALGVEDSVSLDVVAKNEVVNRHCLTNIDAYLRVIDEDPATPHAVEKPETLLGLLGEDHAWSASQLSSILDRSGPDSAIENLSHVPQSAWQLLAKKQRFALTVLNLTDYIEQHGVDAELASHLTADGAVIQTHRRPGTDDADDIEEAADAQKTPLALKLLNAHGQLRAADRVALAAQLDVGPSDLTLAEVEPAPDDLLAEALDRGLLKVSEEAFARFATAGWPAISGALARHSELRQFVTALRMNDWLTQGLLEDDAAPSELHDRVFEDFDAFIAPTSAEQWLYRAVARRAVRRGEKLSIERIVRIANHAPDQDTVVELLAAHQGIDGDELVAVLRLLGPPYDNLEPAGEEGDVPAGDAAATVFNRLAATDKVRLVKRKTRFQVL
ncbi:YobI family P-loop NTPase [Blastococcus goldschmidtiae]|uniref:YobI family P-loop NTPase n=1 Tax=Blastococcus goldschmidtiae TaxID=3075546 RepID=UPI0037BF54AE